MAKAEGGTITVYAGIDAGDWAKAIQPAFLKQYPWANVNYVGLSLATTNQRVISEYQAGKVAADAVISTNCLDYYNQGAVVKVNNSAYLQSLGYPALPSFATDVWHPVYMNPSVILYNKLLVSAQNAPKTYQDLANPMWKGKITMQNPSALGGSGGTFATLLPILGNASWTSLMKGIAANQPNYASSNSVAFTSVESGQFAVGIGLVSDYINAVKGGNSSMIGASFPIPVVTAIVPSCLPKGAPHPYGGQLMINWLSSPEGQIAMGQTGRLPPLPSVQPQFFSGYVPSNTTFVYQGTGVPTFFTNPTQWVNTFRAIFGG